MCSLEDTTPSADSTILVHDSIKQQKLPWGRLYSMFPKIASFDLVKNEFKCGRSVHCDVVLHEAQVKNFGVVSKLHFIITKESSDSPVFIKDLSKNGTFINGVLIGKQKKQVLQNDDEISTGFRGLKLFTYKHLKSIDHNYLPPELNKKYELGKVLGQGGCGEVRLVYEKATCQQYAVKKVKKSTASQIRSLNHPLKIRNEIDILQGVSHPNIISIKEFVETEENCFIILEYMAGGDLTNRILSINRMPESRVKFYFYQILLAIDHLHQKGITHRDIKAENVLLMNEDDYTRLKVTDFGLSKMIDDDMAMKTICGTPSYVAPEILDRKTYKSYSNQVDVWSMGVLLFYMLSSEMPFRSSDGVSLEKAILTGAYEMQGPNWQNVSKSAKDLVRSMLFRNPNCRIKIKDIFTHKWICEDIEMINKVSLFFDSSDDEADAESREETKSFSSNTTCGGASPPAKRFRPAKREGSYAAE